MHGVVHHQRTSRRTRSLVLINLCAVDYSVLRGIKIAKFHTDWCDHHRDICPEPKKIKQLRQQDAYLANAGGDSYNYVQQIRPLLFNGYINIADCITLSSLL